MGVELVLAIADAPSAERFTRANRDRLCELVQEAVGNVTDLMIQIIADDLGDPGMTREDVAERAEDALDNLLSNRRSVVYVTRHGRAMWIAGGMSWGDTPSESYADVAIMDVLQPDWEAA